MIFHTIVSAIFLLASILGLSPMKQEHPMDCGVASTEMILNYYGEDFSGTHDEMRGSVPESKGLPSEKISENLNSRGFTTEWKVLYPFEFIQFIKAEMKDGRPTVVILKSGRNSYHTVVVVGIDDEKIYYANPTNGEIMSKKIKDFTRMALTDYGIFALQIKSTF